MKHSKLLVLLAVVAGFFSQATSALAYDRVCCTDIPGFGSVIYMQSPSVTCADSSSPYEIDCSTAWVTTDAWYGGGSCPGVSNTCIRQN